MQRRKAGVVLNPHGGQNLTQLPHVLAVLSAAGWKTGLAIKEYGGQAQDLAQEAAEQDVDLLIAYGGDGTLNQVINGAMNAHYQGVVGVLPGGTANVWATEVGIPADPVKAALTLVNSAARPVDIGHVTVTALTMPETTSSGVSHGTKQAKKAKKHKGTASTRARHHFLLMAGLGLDAAVMGAVSKPLKYRLGPLAVGLAAAKEVPTLRPFPLEIRSTPGTSRDEVLWKGEALQVIIGNTRLYARVVEMTPDAMIDDGLLDVCVIIAGEPLTTLQQIVSLLLHRTPAEGTAEYARGAHLSLRAPASIPLQLDGSAVKLKDYLGASDRQTLKPPAPLDEVFITYRFDALPRALQLAIPRDYDDTLFQQKQNLETSQLQKQPSQQADVDLVQYDQQELPALQKLVKALGEHGRTVKVIGGSPFPEKENAAIIAGSWSSRKTGEAKPVAIQVDEQTMMVDKTGRVVAPALVRNLVVGKEVVVTGKKNKRGVIKARRLLV